VHDVEIRRFMRIAQADIRPESPVWLCPTELPVFESAQHFDLRKFAPDLFVKFLALICGMITPVTTSQSRISFNQCQRPKRIVGPDKCANTDS
jgi:hypothetical protein